MDITTFIIISLILAASSIVLSELLRPKPKFENARPAGLGDFKFPTAIEGRVVPIVWGTVKCAGPNVIWWGDLKQRPVKKTIKTGLWSSKTVVTAYQYNVGMQLALCRGPIDALRQVWIGDSRIGDVNLTSDGVAVPINLPDLFGGDGFGGGGMVGNFRLFTGREDQPTSSYLAGFQSPLPAYRGTSYVVWEGGYVGNSTSIKPWSFEVQRFPNRLGLASGGHVVNTWDANLAEVAYELLTDTDWGFGLAATEIDVATFQAAGNTLKTEGNGFSLILDNPREAAELLRELERQMDGVVTFDQQTGLFRLSLARGGYDINAVAQLVTPAGNGVEVEKFSRGLWDETKNQVRVPFTDRSRDYFDTFAKADDLANQRIQNGEVVQATATYPGVKDRALAARLASRGLRNLSAPLARASVVVDRSFWNARIGDVVAWTDATLGFTKLAMRVVGVDFGDAFDGKIRLNLVQDVFQFTAAFFGAPDDTLWTPTSQAVAAFPVAQQRAIEAPWAIVRRDQDLPEVMDRLLCAGRAQTGAEVSFQIFERDAVGTPAGSFLFAGEVVGFCLIGQLRAALAAGTANPAATISINGTPDSLAALQAAFTPGPSPADLGQNLLNLLLVDDEFVAVTSVLNQTTYLDLQTVYRGMLDSAPAAHLIDANVFLVFVAAGLSQTSIVPGNNVDVKLRPKSRTAQVAEGSANTIALQMRNRCRSPYPPTNAKLNTVLYQTSVAIDTMKAGGTTLDDRGVVNDYTRRDYRTYDEVRGIGTDAGTLDSTYPAANTTQHLVEIAEDSVTLLSSLAAFWRLEEASGSRADVLGSVTLSDINTVTSGVGKIGTAADFEIDNSEYLEAANSTLLNLQNVDFTLSAWVKMESKAGAASGNVIMGKHAAQSNQRQYLLFYDGSADRFRFVVSSDGNPGTGVNADVLGSPALDTWYHVLAWHDAAADRIFIQVNGGGTNSAAHAGGAFSSSAKFRLGSLVDGAGTNTFFLDGLLDAVGVWTRVLTPAERASLYNAGAGQEHPFATLRTLFSSGWITGATSFASRTKILRNAGGSLVSPLRVKIKSRHTYEAIVRESLQTLEHPFALAASTLDDDRAMGVLALNVVGLPYVAPTTGTYTFNLGVALGTGAVEARKNGGAFSSVIAAGNTTGTLVGVTAGDLLEVRHTQTGSAGLETFLEVDAPSSSADAYAILTY